MTLRVHFQTHLKLDMETLQIVATLDTKPCRVRIHNHHLPTYESQATRLAFMNSMQICQCHRIFDFL